MSLSASCVSGFKNILASSVVVEPTWVFKEPIWVFEEPKIVDA